MTKEPILLKEKTLSERLNETSYSGYICRDEEFETLEYFKSDYKDLGDYDTAMRFFGEDRVREDMCWAVFDGVMEIKECGYKEALFILSILQNFFNFYDGKYPEFLHIGDYEKLYELITNRIMNKTIWG